MSSQKSARVATDDPSDWPQEFQELRNLDNLLRCSICFEYFNTAVMATRCCHNYCSFCARKHITYKAQCPSCPAEMHPRDLKCNRALDEIVRIFVALRPRLLMVLKEHKEVKKNERASHKDKTLFVSPYAKAGSSQRKTARNNNSNNTRSSANHKQRRTKDDEDDFEPIKSKKRKDFNQSTSGSSTTTLTGSDFDSGPGDDQGLIHRRQGKQMGQCPVCLKSIPLKSINKHLDDVCLLAEGQDRRRSERSARKTSSIEPQSKRMRTRSHVNVETTQLDLTQNSDDEESQEMSDRDSDMTGFSDHESLPESSPECTKTRGTPDLESNEISSSFRRTLQNRLKQFILLHNSECDALQPKPVAEIIKEVERTETAQKRLDKGPVVIRTFDRSKTDAEKEKFNEDYLTKHRDHFESLIKDVRSRKKNVKQFESTSNETSTQSRRAQDGVSQSLLPASQIENERTDCTDISEDRCFQNNTTVSKKSIGQSNFEMDKHKTSRPMVASRNFSSDKLSVSTANMKEDESASGKLLTTMPREEAIKRSQREATEFSLSSRLSQRAACAKGKEKSFSSVHEDQELTDLSPRHERSFGIKSKEELGSPTRPIDLEDYADDSSESDSSSKDRTNISKNRIGSSHRRKNEMNKSSLKSSQRETKDDSFNSRVSRHGTSLGRNTGMKHNSSTGSKRKTIAKKGNTKSSKKIDAKSKKGKTVKARNITSFFNKVPSDQWTSRNSDDTEFETVDLDNENGEMKHDKASQNKSRCEEITEEEEISFFGRSSPLFDDSEGSGGHNHRLSQNYNSSQSRETVAKPPSPADLDLSAEDSDTLLL
eukprot:Seg122.2 transcript_id=Seg122.2/GoldUCD/mRNA.D3Y31 product="E3 ubiquitin-protein ligase RAD18" protein_id=Seg122.2/GoldUCD/D3Y31